MRRKLGLLIGGGIILALLLVIIDLLWNFYHREKLDTHDYNRMSAMIDVVVKDKNSESKSGRNAFFINIKDSHKTNDTSLIQYSVSESKYHEYCIGDTISANELLLISAEEEADEKYLLKLNIGSMSLIIMVMMGIIVFSDVK